MNDPDSRYRSLLARQLQMNQQSWRSLVAHGITPDTQVRIDFTYIAPDERAARQLETLLREQTDYDVTTRPHAREWVVTGRTQDTSISPDILNQWVDWMVTAGLEVGCEFDGWGTEV